MKTRWFSDSEGRNRGLHKDPTRAAALVEPAAAEPLIELRDVSLKFVNYSDKMYTMKRAVLELIMRRERQVPNSAFWALRNINLRIQRGERIGVVGSNGAGKSTLLRLLARIYPPSSGSIEVRGMVAPLIEMGAGFNHELSGLDNIVFNGAMFGFTRRQMLAKVDGIHEFTGLREFADLPLKYYSSGMYARLAFGVATEIDPEILLVDESLGVGDATFREKAKNRIRSIMDRSHAVVLVSHELSSLRELCDRGLWLRKGELVADGPIDEILDAYVEWIQNPQVEPTPGPEALEESTMDSPPITPDTDLAFQAVAATPDEARSTEAIEPA